MLSRLLVAVAIGASTVFAGNAYMPPLPAEVQADLFKRDPSEYQTFPLTDPHPLSKRKVPQNLLGSQFKCNTKTCMSITFDDGVFVNMRNITNTALEAGIKVTFFINLYNYACSYDEEYSSQVQYAYRKGMEICSECFHRLS
jgi:peptidoglycan/xylan/chitin deacetylase (PgdA/CDA1 family)